MVLAEHNDRLPPVADKRRELWRRGQRKFALQAIIFFGHRKSRERSPKIRDFRASGIPVQECVERFDTLKERLRFFLRFMRSFKVLSVFLFFELKRIEKSNQMYYN